MGCFSPKMLVFAQGEAFYDVVSREKSQFSGLAQVGNSLFVVTYIYIGESAVVVSIGKARVKFYHLVIVCDGCVLVAQHGKQVGTVIVGICKVGSQLDDFV